MINVSVALLYWHKYSVLVIDQLITKNRKNLKAKSDLKKKNKIRFSDNFRLKFKISFFVYFVERLVQLSFDLPMYFCFIACENLKWIYCKKLLWNYYMFLKLFFTKISH